jgi:hypothetical protein
MWARAGLASAGAELIDMTAIRQPVTAVSAHTTVNRPEVSTATASTGRPCHWWMTRHSGRLFDAAMDAVKLMLDTT